MFIFQDINPAAIMTQIEDLDEGHNVVEVEVIRGFIANTKKIRHPTQTVMAFLWECLVKQGSNISINMFT